MKNLSKVSSIVLSLSMLCTLVACSGGSSDGGDKGKAESLALKSKTEKTETKKEAKKAVMNPKVVEFVDAIGQNCKIDEKYGRVSKCANKEDRAVYDWVRKEEPTDLFETLGQMLVGKDAKKSAIAASLTTSLFTSKGTEWREKNATKVASDSYMEFVKNNDNNVARNMTQYATHLAMMKGEHEALFAMVNGHKNEKVKLAAYESYMAHGRMTGFKELERITKGNKDKKVIQAALRSPRNMYKETDKEKAAFCPWAESYLGDKDLDIAAASAKVMVKCKGEYIDKMIDEGEKRVEAGEYKRPLAMVYREPCFGFISGITKEAGSDKQCERLYGFLQGVADNEKVDSKTRGSALWNIYYQRRDQKTLDLMRKYENHKDAEIAKKAKEAIASLVKNKKLK